MAFEAHVASRVVYTRQKPGAGRSEVRPLVVPGGKYSPVVVVGVVEVGDVVIALPTSQTCLYLVNSIL